MVEETDPQAKALGYVTDATKVDPAKFPKYEKGQHCANCALYQGKERRSGCAVRVVRRQASGRAGLVQRLVQEGVRPSRIRLV